MKAIWRRLAGVIVGGLGAACALLLGLDGQREAVALAGQGSAGDLLISAVHVGLPGWGGLDEAFQIANPSLGPVVLTDSLQVVNQAGRALAFSSSGYTLAPGARIWCARNALSFTLAFGFAPALEYGYDSTPDVPNMSLDASFALSDHRGWLVLSQLQRVDTANPGGGSWPAGSNQDKSSMERRDPALGGEAGNWASSTNMSIGLDATGAPIVGTPRYTNTAYVPGVAAGASAVVINEVAWAGTAASPYDEWIELYNNTGQEIDLAGWLLRADDGMPSIQLNGKISARGFYLLERGDDNTVSNIRADQIYAGVLENEGETLSLYQVNVIDALVYGPEDVGAGMALAGIAAMPEAGWIGAPLLFYDGGSLSIEGQILFRKQDEATGALWPDTDSAADWANDVSPGRRLYGPVSEGDLYGKRVMYPGWEAAADRTLPAAVALSISMARSVAASPAASATLTVAVAPDNAYDVLADLLSQAREEILIGAYTFDSVWLTEVLTDRIRAGVQVTMLLEGGPGGGLSEAALWNCARIAEAGGRVYFMHHDPSARIYSRYRNQHAKYVVVDRRWVAVGSENFGNHGLPVDDKSNGTAGDRGVFVITDQRQVVDEVRALFAQDCDPLRHQDVVAYGQMLRYTVPPTYTAVYSTGGGGYAYMAPFSATLPGVAADRFELLVVPETALPIQEGLLGLVLRAGPGDRIDVEQLNEAQHWGAASSSPDVDPNPRLEAYIEAARNGARVRLLLDSGLDDQGKNRETALYVTGLAQAEGLDLQIRLGNPTQRGIHNKMLLVDLGPGEQYVHVGSINGSETANKINRELALQFRSPEAYAYLNRVFEYDWTHSGGAFDLWLPVVYNQIVPEAGHVVISEVVFKLPGGAEKGEWIELYNPTGEAVDLSGWMLGDAVYRTDYERRYAFPEGASIAPGGTLVIARQAASFRLLAYESQARADFEWQNSDETPNLIRTGWGKDEFLLGNEGDEVLLLDRENRVVDLLVYGSGACAGVIPFFDLSPVYNGHSLERRPANRDSDDCDRDFRVRYTPMPGAVSCW